MRSIVIGIALCSLLSGCGGGSNGPKRYDLSGKVTFAGKPVKFGQISIEPDSTKGNSGPAGSAIIRDGAFDTTKDGKGHVGGAVILRLTGLDAEPPAQVASDNDVKPPLFRDYELTIDLPKETSTKDIEVPMEAAKPKAKTPQRPQSAA